MLLAVFTWFYIPETRDRTLEEIHEMFEKRVPAREFKRFVCTGVEAYRTEAVGGKGGAEFREDVGKNV